MYYFGFRVDDLTYLRVQHTLKVCISVVIFNVNIYREITSVVKNKITK